MKGSALIEGHHYILNEYFRGQDDLKIGKASDLQVGDTLICLQVPTSGNWRNNYKGKSSKFYKLGHPKNIIYSFTNHRPLSPQKVHSGSKMDRTIELQQLEGFVKGWKQTKEKLQAEIHNLKSKIDKAQIRIDNLKKYQSDEEALADIMLKAKEENIGKKELIKIIQNAGISF